MACTRRRDCASWTHYPECPAKYSGAGVLLSDPPPDFSDGGETVVIPAKRDGKERIILHETVDADGPAFHVTILDHDSDPITAAAKQVQAFRGGRSVPSTRATLAAEMLADLEEAVEHMVGSQADQDRIRANIERYKSTTDCTYTLLEVKEMGLNMLAVEGMPNSARHALIEQLRIDGHVADKTVSCRVCRALAFLVEVDA